MKMIHAIIRKEKLNEVLTALFAKDITGISVSKVQGHGGETETVETYRGTTVKMELTEKIKLRDWGHRTLCAKSCRSHLEISQNRRSW